MTSYYVREKRDLAMSVSAYLERNVMAPRAKLFDMLERPIGSARLPRRAGVKMRISTVRYSVDAAVRRHFLVPLLGARRASTHALSFRDRGAILRDSPSHTMRGIIDLDVGLRSGTVRNVLLIFVIGNLRL